MQAADPDLMVGRFPNLFFIGGMRCGSTTLNMLLAQHPDIYMSPVKEPNFFNAEFLRQRLAEGAGSEEVLRSYVANGRFRTRETYASLFASASSEKWVGESSHYLYSPDVAPVIANWSREARVIVSFRNPAERLISEYGYNLRSGKSSESLAEFAFRDTEVKEGRIISFGPKSKLAKGLQAQRIRPWIEEFGASRVRWVFFEDLRDRPFELASELYDWLDVDTSFRPQVVHTEKSGAIKRPMVLRAINSQMQPVRAFKSIVPSIVKQRIRSRLYSSALEKVDASPEVRLTLKDFYREDIRSLEAITGRDLSRWLQ